MIRAQALPLRSEETASSTLRDSPTEPLQTYLKDASHLSGKAQRVFFPIDEVQVASVLRQANQTRTPVTVSGAGTGLTGARVPPEGTILSVERMNRLLKIQVDPKNREGYAVVEPGVSLKVLEEALETQGFFYPPNPGEKEAFIGGTVATNASGARSFQYGPTRRYVRRLKIVLPNGDLLECTRGNEKASGRSFDVTLSDGRHVQVPIPTYTMPPVKNSAGYYAKEGMDLIDLFIGSEGTLGVFTEIELAVLKKPRFVLGGIVFFECEKSCFQFAMEAREECRQAGQGIKLAPRSLEFFDSQSLHLLTGRHPDIPQGAGAALFFEQEVHEHEEQEAIYQVWMRHEKRLQAFVKGSWFSFEPEKQQAFKAFRYHLPVLVNEKVALNSFRKVGTDMAVPDARAEEMLDLYLAELPKSGVDYVIFGHLGDNHLHVNLLPKTAQEFERSQAVYGLLADKAIALGGTISAEHGIGKLRIPYLEWMVGKEGLKEMARVKKALDPNGILSPGNIFPIELLKGV